jgi:hypothetical protein
MDCELFQNAVKPDWRESIFDRSVLNKRRRLTLTATINLSKDNAIVGRNLATR